MASSKKTVAKKQIKKKSPSKKTMEAAAVGRGVYPARGNWAFTGSKNFGEMGPAKEFVLDYEILRIRSWQLYLESDMTQTVIGKYIKWTIGRGLKPQSEPVKRVLEKAKIQIDFDEFAKDIEARFLVYAKSKASDYSNMIPLNRQQAEAHKNTMVGGDMLVILRYINKMIKVQCIDAANVISPGVGSEDFPKNLANGNTIVNGIELSPTGEHVAYYVRQPGIDVGTWMTERIVARGRKSGMLMAYMVYGSRYRLDNHRGIPLLSAIFETIKKLERYKEATVGSAEERQKIAYAVEHDIFSTGENPLLNQQARAYNARLLGDGDDDLPTDSVGDQLANNVAATTNKMTFNLPLGAHLKSVESKNELYFKDFYEMNIMLLCAVASIPVEVALSKYDSNFSASRAALKDWENTLFVERDYFSNQFLQPIYELFLYTEILKSNIDAPGYLKAIVQDDQMVLGAYHNVRFVGAPVPHIDPLKEVTAERLKLGDTGNSIPLTTVEAATEALNGGDSDANMEQYAKELDQSKKLNIKPEPEPVAQPIGGAPAPAKKNKTTKKKA